MSALAVFTCRPNSHPFQERHVSVHEPVKIGRSVARARPAQNNAIFDCKVLSRNHALLWYENSKFYLQDTKSSNGTFINNQRLSKGSEESPPREIYSGDVVQFGVDVMENSRRVTHGCIIASITLYHPDGSECKPSQSSPFLNAPAGAAGMQCQELYQLAQCLQEALHREQMLESKLAALQRLVQSTQEASETGWQAFMDEDRLLSRLEVLENQLSTYSKNQSEDTLRQELVALQDDKLKYETTAKESLRKVLQEKLEAVTKLTDLESSLSNTGEECTHLKEMCEMSQKELEQLAEKHQEQLEEITGLQNKLQEVERDHKEECELIEKEKSDLQARLDEVIKQEESLNAKVEALQADNDFTKEQLANMKVRLETMKENSTDSELTKTEELGVQVDIALIEQVAVDTQQELQDEKDQELDSPSPSEDEKDQELDSPSPSEDKLKETQLQIEEYKAQLKESDSRLEESKEKIENLQSDLELAQKAAAASMTKMNELEKNFKLSDVHVDVMLENTVADLKLQLEESRNQASSSEELISTLKDQVERLERELSLQRESSQGQSYETNSNSIPTTSNHVDQNHLSNHYREEIERLKELLEDAKGSAKKTESNAEKCKGDLKAAQCDMKALSEEMNQLRSQLINTEQQAKDSDDHVRSLTDELEKADFTTKEVKEHILVLRGQLEEEQESHQEHCQQLQEVKGQLHDAQERIRQSREEAEQLRIKLQEFQDEKETVHATRASELAEVPNRQHGGTELSTLKDECSRLKTRIQDIEKEMKLSRTENNNLRSEYNKLQESYRELEALKDHLEHEQDDWQNNLTDAQKSAEQSKLLQATAEINRLKEHCSVCEDQVKALKTDYDDLNNDFQFLAYKSRTLSYCAMLPLLMLLLAFLLAMYPFLASVTATTLPT